MGTMGQFQSPMPRKTKAQKIKAAVRNKPNPDISSQTMTQKAKIDTSFIEAVPKKIVIEKQKTESVPAYFFQDLFRSIITSVAIIGLVIALFFIQKS